MEDWDGLQPLLLQTLSPLMAKVQAKIQLENICQGENEPVIDFVERLQTLLDQYYDKPAEKQLKDSILKDMLIRGLRDDHVRVAVLVANEDLDLTELIQLATRHDLAVKALSLSQKHKKGEETVSILTVPEIPAKGPNYSGNKQSTTTRKCYECGSANHLIRSCSNKKAWAEAQRRQNIQRQTPTENVQKNSVGTAEGRTLEEIASTLKAII